MMVEEVPMLFGWAHERELTFLLRGGPCAFIRLDRQKGCFSYKFPSPKPGLNAQLFTKGKRALSLNLASKRL